MSSSIKKNPCPDKMCLRNDTQKSGGVISYYLESSWTERIEVRDPHVWNANCISILNESHLKVGFSSGETLLSVRSQETNFETLKKVLSFIYFCHKNFSFSTLTKIWLCIYISLVEASLNSDLKKLRTMPHLVYGNGMNLKMLKMSGKFPSGRNIYYM